MPNPSLIAADLEKRREQLHTAIHNAHNKTTKKNLLRELRKVETELGVESVPYNSNAFSRGGKHDPSPTEGSVLTLADLRQAKLYLRTATLPYMDVGIIIRALQRTVAYDTASDAEAEDAQLLLSAILNKR